MLNNSCTVDINAEAALSQVKQVKQTADPEAFGASFHLYSISLSFGWAIVLMKKCRSH